MKAACPQAITRELDGRFLTWRMPAGVAAGVRLRRGSWGVRLLRSRIRGSREDVGIPSSSNLYSFDTAKEGTANSGRCGGPEKRMTPAPKARTFIALDPKELESYVGA